jgi:hypothetical protein
MKNNKNNINFTSQDSLRPSFFPFSIFKSMLLLKRSIKNYKKKEGSQHNSSQLSLQASLLGKKLTEDYIAGFVQADGSFSATLTRKTRGEKVYFNISLTFTIVQSQKYKDLILEIQKKFGGIGHWYLNKKDKTIKYQVKNQTDLLNIIIPFFMKNQLRDKKLLSFLRFKYIVEIVSSKIHLKNKNILLSLIVIGGQLNPSDKLGNKIRYLNPEEQHYVINNIIPEGLDISKLTESIANFKSNPLTLDFVHGLFKSNTNNYKKVSKEDQDFIRDNFLPEGVQLYLFKEYYLGLNQPTYLEKSSNVFSKNKSLDTRRSRGDRSFSSVAKNTGTGPMNSWFLTGFIDAEGCFLINIYKKKGLKIG